MLLTVTCGSATHTERTVAFQVKQWLHERVTMLTLYVHCLSCYISDNHWMAYNRKVDRGVSTCNTWQVQCWDLRLTQQ